MKNVYIYCEGQTEEAFINELLFPYFMNLDIYVRPIICTTKRTKTHKYKGGVNNYNKIKDELQILCKQHKNEVVTTMFDYYAMPDNTPNIDNSTPDIYIRMNEIENTINKDIGMSNLFFNFSLHEFEGLLFSEPSAFNLITSDAIIDEIKNIKDSCETPEHINNSSETAPSKRLIKLITNYSKIRHGVIIAKNIGIDNIINECKHFSDWIQKIRTC